MANHLCLGLYGSCLSMLARSFLKRVSLWLPMQSQTHWVHVLNFRFSLLSSDLGEMHHIGWGIRFSEQLLEGPDAIVQKYVKQNVGK